MQAYYDGTDGRGVVTCNARTPALEKGEVATVACSVVAPDNAYLVVMRRI
jgi:hypothetical protein